jgi:four helix bundle protein
MAGTTEDRRQMAEEEIGTDKMSERIESFRDLNVYKLAIELQQKIFELTKRFPKGELYSLTDQIRRSSRSIGANIAESWQKRRYPAHFVSKLSDADAEQAETQHWLDTSLKCNYLSTQEHSALLGKCQRIGKMLGTMMIKPHSFCGKHGD